MNDAEPALRGGLGIAVRTSDSAQACARPESTSVRLRSVASLAGARAFARARALAGARSLGAVGRSRSSRARRSGAVGRTAGFRAGRRRIGGCRGRASATASRDTQHDSRDSRERENFTHLHLVFLRDLRRTHVHRSVRRRRLAIRRHRLFVSKRLCLRVKATKVSSKLASFFL